MPTRHECAVPPRAPAEGDRALRRFGTDLLPGLELLLAIARDGSITRAAQALGTTQPAASRRLAALEAAIGAPLFKRTTRSLAPTEAGAALIEAARGVVLAAEAAVEAARDAAGAPGVLRVTVPAAFGRRHVLPHLAEFRRAAPDIAVRLHLADEVTDLMARDTDLAIRIGQMPDSGLISAPVARQRRVLCAAPDYLAARGAPSEPEDLAGHACLLNSRLSAGGRWNFQQRRARREVAVSGPLAANSTEALLDAALHGMGVVLLASWAVHREVAAGRLVPLLPGWSGDTDRAPRQIAFLWAPELSRAPRLRRFVDFLKVRFGRPPYWDKAEG